MFPAVPCGGGCERHRARTASTPWEEHGGSTLEAPVACGECQYEEDHAQQVPGRETCWNSVPPALFVRPTARELERAAPLHRKVLLRFGQLMLAMLHLVVRWP